MIGLIITGHGEFASGMLDATEMIAGKQENYKKVLFKEDTNLDSLSDELSDKIVSLLRTNEGVVILTDLKGGTPFNNSMLLASNYDNVEVIPGVNLPISIEATMHAQLHDNAKELVNYLVEIGTTGIEVVELLLEDESTEDEDEGDGI